MNGINGISRYLENYHLCNGKSRCHCLFSEGSSFQPSCSLNTQGRGGRSRQTQAASVAAGKYNREKFLFIPINNCLVLSLELKVTGGSPGGRKEEKAMINANLDSLRFILNASLDPQLD